MKLSSRSRYGFAAALQLAANYGNKPLTIKTIAESSDISSKYFEQLIALLIRGGFVSSIRGPKGGYILTRSPDEVKLSQVVSALEGPLTDSDCAKHARFAKACNDCAICSVWNKAHDAMWSIFDALTLQDLVNMTTGKKKP